MLTRRHIRIKVMQCIYALTQSGHNSLEKQEKFLKKSIEQMYDLYLLVLSLLSEVHQLAEKHAKHAEKKYLSTAEDRYPNPKKFVENQLLLQIAHNSLLQDALSQRKLNAWYINEEYIKIIYRDITASPSYKDYMMEADTNYEKDKAIVLQLFKQSIAPNDKI